MCVRACVRMCACVRMRACVRVCVRVRAYVCVFGGLGSDRFIFANGVKERIFLQHVDTFKFLI